mmetsp:Transcript_116973/g.218779  ORF Transcript_116973/g.218779 Transcript_116973/m.218779 type:complete len:252 (-) Transcript_116973:62-817(-)
MSRTWMGPVATGRGLSCRARGLEWRLGFTKVTAPATGARACAGAGRSGLLPSLLGLVPATLAWRCHLISSSLMRSMVEKALCCSASNRTPVEAALAAFAVDNRVSEPFLSDISPGALEGRRCSRLLCGRRSSASPLPRGIFSALGPDMNFGVGERLLGLCRTEDSTSGAGPSNFARYSSSTKPECSASSNWKTCLAPRRESCTEKTSRRASSNCGQANFTDGSASSSAAKGPLLINVLTCMSSVAPSATSM